MKYLDKAVNNIHKQLIETTDIELLNLFDQLKRINKRLNMEEYIRISNEKKLKDSILTLTTPLENVRFDALNWWNKLDKWKQRSIELETFGEGEPWEDNSLTDYDIIVMFEKYNK